MAVSIFASSAGFADSLFLYSLFSKLCNDLVDIFWYIFSKVLACYITGMKKYKAKQQDKENDCCRC